MQQELIFMIRRELEQQADPRTQASARSYFKEPITVYGVRTAIVNQIAQQKFQLIKHLDKDVILDLAEELLQSDRMEEAFIAFDWAYRVRSNYQPGDFLRFENWLAKYVNNWAKCDTLCNHAIGAFIECYPEYVGQLKTWAKSENRWLRRASAVSLILPARKGLFLADVLELADILLTDPDDLVQKGYGWMLREAGKLHQTEVFAYIQNRKARMPRTALRYAIEKMPEEMRQSAMAK